MVLSSRREEGPEAQGGGGQGTFLPLVRALSGSLKALVTADDDRPHVVMTLLTLLTLTCHVHLDHVTTGGQRCL